MKKEKDIEIPKSIWAWEESLKRLPYLFATKEKPKKDKGEYIEYVRKGDELRELKSWMEKGLFKPNESILAEIEKRMKG